MSHSETRIIAEFQGIVSPKNRQYQLRRLKKRTVITMACAMAIVYAVAVGIYIGVIESWFDSWIAFLLMGGVCLLAVIASIAIPPTKKDLDRMFPKRICFLDDEDKTVRVEGETFSTEEYTDLFRKVVDMGDFYYIDIIGRSGFGYTCQKNLLTAGSLKSFEKLFEGKMIRGKQEKDT